jgi:hypothetical protein
MLLEQPPVLLPARATVFTVICATCMQTIRDRGYLGATVTGTLSLDADGCTVMCPHGHELRIERAG